VGGVSFWEVGEGKRMKSGGALLWKEWREIRWFLVAGVVIFTGWPLLEAMGHYRLGEGFYSTDMPEVMAFLLGGPFAILVAVGVTCRDLKEDIACFWQSRPVSIRRWAATKYLVGLAVVLIVLCVPLVLKIFIMRAEHELGQLSSILTCHTFTVIFIYSISFLAGCLIRTPVYAVIFSGALALLVYFLPILAPPLEGLSVFNIMMQPPVQVVQLSTLAQGELWIAEKMRVVKIPWADDLALRYNIDLLRYIAFALVGSFAAVVLSGIVVKKNWRLKVGQKLMFWLLGGVGMFLFLTVVFQLRSNLECVRQIPLKPEGKGTYNVEVIACDGDKGVLLLRGREPNDAVGKSMRYSLMTFDLSAKEPFGEEIVIPQDLSMAAWWFFSRGKLVWSAKRPQWTYFIEMSSSKNKTDSKKKVDKMNLLTISLAKGGVMTVVDKLDLLPYLGDRARMWGMYMLDSTIYASTGDKLLIFDVGADGKPVLRKVINGQFGTHDKIGRVTRKQIRQNTFSMPLVPVEGFNIQERLKITIELSGYPLIASDGDIVVVVDEDFPILRVYRLKEVKDDVATLEMAGFRRPTPLERFTDIIIPTQVFVRDGLAYVVGYGLGGLSVYDIRRPQQIRRIGHYAAPKEWLQAIAPLPDGNILVGGSKLHIVAPPKVKR
jgi:hypothetical protein